VGEREATAEEVVLHHIAVLPEAGMAPAGVVPVGIEAPVGVPPRIAVLVAGAVEISALLAEPAPVVERWAQRGPEAPRSAHNISGGP
jgi:hypothetical protein